MILARSRLTIPALIQPTHQIRVIEKYDSEEESTSPVELVLKFDDTEELQDERAVSYLQVERMVRWLQALPNEFTLMITCFAGSSRSPAIAAVAHSILEYKTNKTYPKVEGLAACLISSCTGIPNPNGLILTYADQILGTTLLTDLYWTFKNDLLA